MDDSEHDDEGIGTPDHIIISPTNANGLAFSRTPGDVLNIVYLTPDSVDHGGFFPAGVNGKLHHSSAL